VCFLLTEALIVYVWHVFWQSDEIGSLRDDPMIDHAVNITDQDFFNEFSGDDFDEDLPKLS